MGKYIEIRKGRVNHIVVDDDKVEELVKVGLNIKDISRMREKPEQNTLYKNGKFTREKRQRLNSATTESRLRKIEACLETIAEKVGA